MKKRVNFIVFSLIAISVFFGACRNLVTITPVNRNNKCYIKIQCNTSGLNNFAQSRQTFFPTGPENEEDLENFILKGIKEDGTEVTLKIWKDYGSLRFSDPVEIDKGKWTLLLTADYDGNTCYGAKLVNVEIVPGDVTPITFKLAPLANGTGTVEVSLTWAVEHNQVKCVKAEMFDGNGLEVYSLENISFAKDVDDDTLFCATYLQNSVPVGSYILKFYLYRDAAGTDLINAFTYGIQVAGDLWTGGVVQITMLNYKWKLTLDTNGGSWRRGVVITLDTFNEFDYVTLPGKSSIKLDEYSFRGWTLDPADPTAEVFTSWEPGKMSDDVTLYASWKELRDTVWIFLKGDDPGDDGNDGLDSSRPLRTLGRAIELIKEDYSDAKVNIMVMTAYTLADGEENSFDLANDFDVPVKIVRDQNVGGTLFVIDASKLSNANLKFTNVTIEGNKANITVSNPTSLIKVLGTASNKAVVTLGMDATLQNNKSTSNGAGIYLNQYAELKMLDGSSITGNEVSGNSAYGDGIYSDGGTVEMNGGAVKGPEGATEYRSGHGIHMNGGALTVTGGEISGNRGSGLYNAKGTLSVEPEAGKSVEIKGNKGYGIYASGATATLDKGSGDRLEISGNGSNGIYNYAKDSAGTLSVTGALVSGNESYGIYNYASGAAATLTVTGALVSGNGGGIYNYAYSADATATLTDTDITDNTFTGICSVAESWRTYRAKVALSGTTKVNGNSATGSDYASGGGVYCKGYYYSSSYYPETCVLEVGEDVEISGNKARISGGGIYCKCATVTIDGGKVKDNTAREGGGIYCAVGSVVTLKNYADVGGNTAFWESTSAGNGGGIYCAGATVDIGGGSRVSGNTARVKSSYSSLATAQGGGIYIAAGGAVALGECEVIGNTAVAESTYSGSSSSYYAIAYGGGVYNEGTLSVSGGEVKGNTASATATAMSLARGNGIYNNATLNMSGAAKIDSDNDIYLAANKFITVTGSLAATSDAGKITPSVYKDGVKVLAGGDGVTLSAEVGKFALSDTSEFMIYANGTLAPLGFDPIYIVQGATGTTGSIADPVGTLDKAIKLQNDAKAEGKKRDIYITEKTYEFGPDEGITAPVTVYREPTFKGVMVSVAGGSAGSPIVLANITLDGRKATVLDATGRLLSVAKNAHARLGAGAVLKDNIAGGAYVDEGGSLEIDGGEITGNTSASHGAGVYNKGALTIKSGSITGNEVSGNSAYGDGVYSEGGAVEMSGGSVKGAAGATAYASGHGVYMAGGELTVTGGEISGHRGSGVYIDGGTLSVEPANGKSVEIKGNKSNGIYAEGAETTLDKGLGAKLEISGNGSNGIYNYAKDSAGTLSVTGALVSGNESNGIYNYAYNRTATLTVDKSSVSENGRGIYNYASSGDAMATITDTDINDNTSSSNGGGILNSVYESTSSTAKVVLSGMTKVSGNSSSSSGGGVYCNGYIYTYRSPYTYYYAKCVLEVGAGVEISGNNASSGGGVYSSCATVTIDGGIITGNNASSGGGIYSASSSLVTLNNSAEVSGNTAGGEGRSNSYGGGIYCVGGTVDVKGGSKVNDNTVLGKSSYSVTAYGGGIYSASGGTVKIGDGCEVKGNAVDAECTGSGSSYGATAYGGGVYNMGTLALTGGTVEGNSVTAVAASSNVTTLGDGVYNGGTMQMSGAAKIDQDNDIYILASSSKIITVAGELTSSGIVGVITPDKYERDIQVITNNEYVGSSYEKFEVSPAANGEFWTINSIGRISQTADTSVIFLDITQGSDSNVGTSETTAVQHLKAAIEKLSGENPTIVFVSPYTLRSDEKECLKFDSKVTFRRFAAFTSGSTSCTGNILTIDSSVTSTESAPIEISNITFDGNKTKIASADTLLNIDSGTNSRYVTIAGDVVVQNNGGTGIAIGENVNVNVESGAVIKNNIVGISNSGTLTIDGAKIISNSGNGINNTGTLTVNNATTEINSNSYGIRNSGPSANATINNGTISLNKSAGIYNENKGTVTLNDGTITKNKALSTSGAGIYNTGSGSKLYINGGSITDHTITYTSSSYVNVYGAGIYNNSGTVEITGGTISGNKVEHTYYASYAQGGGIYNSGTLTISGGTIENNTAYNGAGVYNYSTFTLKANPDDATKSPVIKNNTATNNGGGIYNGSGTLTVSGGKISSNRAVNGGGIYNNSGTFTLSGGTITVNNATYGGGIYNKSTLTISGGAIISNSVNPPNGNGSGIYNAATLNMRDDAIIDPSNNLYLDNSSATRYITITGAINGTGTIASIMMASYTNSYTQVLYSYRSGSSGVEIDQALCNRFKLSDESYCVAPSRSGYYYYYGNLAKLGASGNITLPSAYTFTLQKNNANFSGTSLTAGDKLSFKLGASDVVPSSGVKYKIAVLQGGVEIPSLTKQTATLNDATVTIPSQLTQTKQTVDIYMAVIITVGTETYTYDRKVQGIKVE